jgi:8-oxo-dGTP pyrophosphatase MutT (NUDIX family)
MESPPFNPHGARPSGNGAEPPRLPVVQLQEYNCGFMIDGAGNMPLVRKQRPAWQYGLLNGIGGKQEDGETPEEGMAREWREETGDEQSEWRKVCALVGNGARVHFFVAEVDVLPDFPPFNDSGELIEMHNVSYVPNMPDVIPNLKWLIPAALEREFRIELPN